MKDRTATSVAWSLRPFGRPACQQRAIRIARSQGALQMRGGSRIDGPVRFDVVTFGDHRGGVSEEGCGGIGPDAAGDHRRPGAPVPAQADAGVAEACKLEELAESASDVVRTQRTTTAAGEDGPVLSRTGDVGDAAAQHDGRELRNGDAPDRVVGLGPRLTFGSAPLVLDDGAVDAGNHPGGSILDVAGAKREHFVGTHGGTEQYFDDVPDLAIRFGAGQTGLASPLRGGLADRGDLLDRQRLRCGLDPADLRRTFDRVAGDRVMTQCVAEEHVEQHPALFGLGRRYRRLLGQEPLDWPVVTSASV